MDVFSRYPLGKFFFNYSRPSVEQVVAHLGGKWYMTDDPWYGVATKFITGEKSGENIAHEVIAGKLPEIYETHCVNYMGTLLIELTDLKLAVNQQNLTVITWKHYGRSDGYMLHIIDEGDPEVGLFGGSMIYSPTFMGVYGDPELGLVDFSEEDRQYQSKSILPTFRWIYNYLTKGIVGTFRYPEAENVL